DYLHARLNLSFGNKRRPVGDYLFDFRAATCEASDRRRPCQNQRRNLFRESLDGAAILASDSYGQLYFCKVWRWNTCERAVCGVRADEFRQDFVELQAKPFKSRPKN